MDKPHQAKTFNEVCVGPEGSTQRWLVKHKEQDLEGEARTVRRQTGTEIQTGCGDHKSLKSSCVGRCDSQQDFQGAKTTPLKQRQMRAGTRAKRAGRAQDISANKIKQTAFAFVSLVCQQVQSKLKV